MSTSTKLPVWLRSLPRQPDQCSGARQAAANCQVSRGNAATFEVLLYWMFLSWIAEVEPGFFSRLQQRAVG